MGFCASATIASTRCSGNAWNMASLRSALPSSSSYSSSPSPPTLSFPVASVKFPAVSPAKLRSSRSFAKPKAAIRSFSGLAPLQTHLFSIASPETDSYEQCFTIIDNGGRISAMRHGKRIPRLNRPPDQRRALLRGLTTQLLKYGRIKTTRARASAMRKHVDKMITMAKEGSLHKRRQALGFIYEKQIVHALFAEVPERYGERNGGYTRIIRTLPRRGDNAPMAYIELV